MAPLLYQAEWFALSQYPHVSLFQYHSICRLPTAHTQSLHMLLEVLGPRTSIPQTRENHFSPPDRAPESAGHSSTSLPNAKFFSITLESHEHSLPINIARSLLPLQIAYIHGRKKTSLAKTPIR